VFVRIHQIPLSANGKLDLALLPPPSDMNLLPTGSNTRPATPLEGHLLRIMQNLLHDRVIGVGDNFFLVGGDSLLGMQLIIMLRDEFGVELTFEQIFDAATVGDLAILIEKSQKEARRDRIQYDLPGSKHSGPEENNKLKVRERGERAQQIEESTLPRGVLPLRERKAHNTIFWVHSLNNVKMGDALGDDQQLIVLALTSKDRELLGRTPSLESIAEQFVRKILGTQPGGPYTIGGFCLGGLLAYEVAVQLLSSGHEVALLMLLDPPAPSDLTMRHGLGPRLTEPRYLLRRIARVGLRMTLRKSRDRLVERLRLLGLQIAGTRTAPAHKMIQAAASAYRGAAYEGKVLLILASDHAPHINFLPEWQALVPNNLHVEYVDGHHSDLMKASYVQHIADAIAPHLGSSIWPESRRPISDRSVFSPAGDD
jgi:thioesterase domain-containing protein/acyl carrier protein